jgi:hypothetical protein
MADRTLTINHADGDSETYTIKRDKFAGVREMSVDGSTVTVDRTAKPKAQSKETTFGVSGQKALDGKREQVNLYGISGQSNGAGRAENGDAGTRFDALDALSSQAFIYNRGTSSFDQFNFGINQTLTGGNSGQFGPESELLRLAVDGSDTKAFVVKYTQGGTNLYEQWDSEAGSNLYSDFVSDYQAAVSSLQAQGYDVIHKGVLFAQGERDSKNDLGGGVISYYEDKQLKFVENLRKDLNIPSLPVSLTLITVLGTLGSTYTHVSEINQAKQNVANTLAHVRVIDSSSFGFKDDDLHYDGDGQVTHGSAFYSQAVGSFSFQYITIKREIEPLLNKVVGGASAAYSLRDLNDKAGNNKVVRARRSSDNAEADFKAKEVADGTLVTWVGASNDGFVESWYDQSGNGNDAVQLTASSQPKIVDAGALVSGGIDFDGVDDFLDTNNDETLSQPLSFFIVANQSSNGTYFQINGSTSKLSLITGGSGVVSLNGGSALVTSTNITGSQKLLSGIASGSSSSIFINGIADVSGNCGAGPTGTNRKLRIGNLYSSSRFSTLKLKELIIYPSDQSANREAIETNINNQYDIY